jgi:hypothetical protein
MIGNEAALLEAIHKTVLKGHGFSRAVSDRMKARALAPVGIRLSALRHSLDEF